ncbi:hypothetical protein [Endozoicomonas sp.]|uniref:hypothetical protein n=1 Tax=Endozoicomonas sp. TaxID=1892382 RepID=UPI00383B41F4
MIINNMNTNAIHSSLQDVDQSGWTKELAEPVTYLSARNKGQWSESPLLINRKCDKSKSKKSLWKKIDHWLARSQGRQGSGSSHIISNNSTSVPIVVSHFINNDGATVMVDAETGSKISIVNYLEPGLFHARTDVTDPEGLDHLTVFYTAQWNVLAVPALSTTPVTTAVSQTMPLEDQRHQTPETSSKVCESEKINCATSLTVQGVQEISGIAGNVLPAIDLPIGEQMAQQIGALQLIETVGNNRETLDDYIKGLGDKYLKLEMGCCTHVKYDMESGLYSYHSPMTYYSQPSDSAGTSMREGVLSAQVRRYFGTLGMTSVGSCVNSPLSVNNKWDEEFRDGDMVTLRTYQVLDIHAERMQSVLNTIKRAVEDNGLPEKVGSLAVKVAVADGYRCSFVLKVKKARGGFSYSRENDPDHLVTSSNLLTITFNKKSDLDELYVFGQFRKPIPSGKTLQDLEDSGQISLKLESGCAEDDQCLIMGRVRQQSVQHQDCIDKGAKYVSSKSYCFEGGDWTFVGNIEPEYPDQNR